MEKVQQYVMAYRADHEAIKKLLPKGYYSLRPVLRINIEAITDADYLNNKNFIRLEFNTPIECKGIRGWLNLATWENNKEALEYSKNILGITKLYADITSDTKGAVTEFNASINGERFLTITHTRVGKEGGCPKENDNEGTFTLEPDGVKTVFSKVEVINEKKEYCNCDFSWKVPSSSDFASRNELLKTGLNINTEEVLGAYVVNFKRD